MRTPAPDARRARPPEGPSSATIGSVPSALQRELDVAIAAARAAGRIQVERYERLERIVHKSEKDVVTEVDHLSEEAILATIGQSFPGDAILAEESGRSGPETEAAGSDPEAAPHAERLWIVDPLDGTINYANGIPVFAVSVALAIDGRPSVGVVLDPLRDEIFTAARGEGATLDGQPIHHPAKERLGDAVVALALPAWGFARHERRIRKAIRVPRSMGSATLALAYVANGRFDAYVQLRGLSLWDICAAGLIAEEAGACVTSATGDPWFDVGHANRSIGIVAAAPGHHGALLHLLR
jgi:myo-inositol-1(or 4)-monophosphatase